MSDRSRLLGSAFASVLAVLPLAARGQLTPEERANPSTGQIPNPSAQEYYYGPVAPNQQSDGIMIGAISGTKATMSWYKFHSDGVTPISFDFFGSAFGFGGGPVLSGGNSSVFAVYTPTGQFVAGVESVKGPATGDSNVPPVQVAGSGPLGRHAYRQPRNPLNPAVSWSTSNNAWLGSNGQELGQLSFVRHPQRNPLWDPAHPQHDPTADWDEYPLLPAGDYFLAVTGYASYFSGYPRHTNSINAYGASYPFASGPVTPTTPFGFVTFHPHDGVYLLHTRIAGDANQDGALNFADRSALWNKVLEFEPTGGIPNAGFTNNDPAQPWIGLPADAGNPNELMRFDLTGNSRIDRFDLLQWGRWTGLAPSLEGDANLDRTVNIADFSLLASSFGQSGTDWPRGDFNYDATTNISDFALMAANFGLTFTPGSTPARSSVPEPTMATLAIGLTVAAALRRRPAR